MDNEVEFVEDRTFLKPLPETKIPKNSIEGWFYKHVPGTIGIKKIILLCIIALLFGASIVLFLLSRPTSVDRVRSANFDFSSYQVS